MEKVRHGPMVKGNADSESTKRQTFSRNLQLLEFRIAPEAKTYFYIVNMSFGVLYSKLHETTTHMMCGTSTLGKEAFQPMMSLLQLTTVV